MSHFRENIYNPSFFFEFFFLKQYNPLGFCTVQNGWISNPSLNGVHWNSALKYLRKTKTPTPLPALPFLPTSEPHPTLDGTSQVPPTLSERLPALAFWEASAGLSERRWPRPVVGGWFRAVSINPWEFRVPNEPLEVESFEKKKKKPMKTRPTRCWRVTYDSPGKKKQKNRMLKWMKMYFKCSYWKKDGKLFPIAIIVSCSKGKISGHVFLNIHQFQLHPKITLEGEAVVPAVVDLFSSPQQKSNQRASHHPGDGTTLGETNLKNEIKG